MPDRPRRVSAVCLVFFLAGIASPQDPGMSNPRPEGLRQRLGHPALRVSEEVRGLGVFPDGTQLVTSSPGGIGLWDVGTGQRVAVAALPSRTGPGKLELPESASLSDPLTTDGKTVALLRHGRVNRYPASLGAAPDALPLFLGIEGLVAVGSTPTNGTVVALTTKGRLIALRTQAEKQTWAQIPLGRLRSNKSLLATGGRLAVFGTSDGGVAVWDILPAATTITGKNLGVVGVADARALALSRDGKWLGAVEGGEKGKGLRIWKVEDLKESATWKCPATEVLALSPGGTIAAGCSGADGKIWLYDIETGKELPTAHATGDVIRFLEFLPKGNGLVAAGKAGVIHVLDPRTGKPLRPEPGHIGAVRAIAQMPDGSCITASNDTTARLWDANGKEVRIFAHPVAVMAAVVSADGKTLFTACADGSVRAWDVAKGTELCQFVAGDVAGAARCVSLSPDGKTLAVGYARGLVHLFNPATLKEPKLLAGSANTVALSYTPAGLLVARDAGHTIRMFDPKAGELRHFEAFAGSADSPSVAVSSDGKFVAGALGEEKESGKSALDVGVWEASSGKLVDRVRVGRREHEVTAVAYISNGKQVVVGDAGGKVWVIDVEKKEMVRKYEGHRGPILGLAVSPDGKTVASGGADTTVLVWDLTKPAP